jgi:hypothetical protein
VNNATKVIPAGFDQIREVTDEEIAFFEENGWVKLDALFSRSLALELLTHIKSVMEARREGADSNVSERAPGTTHAAMVEYVASTNLRESDAWMEALACCRELGEASARLISTRPLRLFADSVFHKRPQGQTGFFSAETPWHQDYPAAPLDRANDLQIWVACNISAAVTNSRRWARHRPTSALTAVRARRVRSRSIRGCPRNSKCRRPFTCSQAMRWRITA